MPDLSILTPIYNPEISFLEDSYRDILNQNIDWEWIIYWDGLATVSLPENIVEDSRVRVFEGEERWGIAITRNRALMKSRGRLIHAHDYDDRLLPGAMESSARVLLGNPSIAYTCGHWDDLVLREGKWEVEEYPNSGIREGILPRGWKSSRKTKEGRAISPPPGSYTFRRLFLEAYGGWGALSTEEDTMIIGTIRERHEGYFLPGVLGLYRKHSSNITNQEETRALAEMHGDFTERRIRALRVIDDLER